MTFFTVSILLGEGCKQRDLPQNPDRSWDKITITSEFDTDITIVDDDDSSTVNVYHNGTFWKPLPKNTKIKIDTLEVQFTRAEKDTIFSLAKDLIEHAAITNKFCTEYVGSLKLNIQYSPSFSKSCEYSSTCNWTTLSDKTKHLHDILRRRIKNIYLGEHKSF